jgi:hypothetical protein
MQNARNRKAGFMNLIVFVLNFKNRIFVPEHPIVMMKKELLTLN